LQAGADVSDKQRRALRSRSVPHSRVALAWRAGPDKIKPVQREDKRVGLMKLKRIPALRLYVHADYIKPGALQPLGSAASAAKQV